MTSALDLSFIFEELVYVSDANGLVYTESSLLSFIIFRIRKTISSNAGEKMRMIRQFYQCFLKVTGFFFSVTAKLENVRLFDYQKIKKICLNHPCSCCTSTFFSSFFDAVNRTKTALSWSELYGFDIDKAVLHFPDIFGLPGGSNSLPDDLLLYEPIVQPFAFGGGEVEEDEEEEEDDDDDDINKKFNDFKDTSSSNVRSSVEKKMFTQNPDFRPEMMFLLKTIALTRQRRDLP